MDAFDDVLDAARAGGEWAWRALYDDLAPTVLGYLRGRGAADPDDLTGEVFLQIVRDLGRFDGDERAWRSWVFTIAHHRLLDDRRRRGRRPEVLAATAELDRPVEGEVEERALEAVTTDEVRRLIEGLSPDQADVLLLRMLAGLTIEEVARAVGKRVGAVKALQRRGLRAIRQSLGELGVPL